MILCRYAHDFTDEQTGKSEFVTFEPIELWTEVGQEIIPPGFRFSFRSMPETVRKLIRDDEIPLFILLEWRRTAENKPRGAAERNFRRELIKYTQKCQNATEGRFWRFLKGRVRAEVICFMVRCFGIFLRWGVFKR